LTTEQVQQTNAIDTPACRVFTRLLFSYRLLLQKVCESRWQPTLAFIFWAPFLRSGGLLRLKHP